MTRNLARERAAKLEAVRNILNDRRGMSLVEVMVVIAIILTLMSVVGYGAFNFYQQSLQETTKIQMTQIAERAQIHVMKGKSLPSGANAVSELYDGMEAPRDGWGNDFIFMPGGGPRDFEIVSLGADGAEGGQGTNADLKWSEVKTH